MGIVIPRPSMRGAESRRIAAAIAASQFEREYHVYNGEGTTHGNYPTLESARGCVAFDGLSDWAIYHGSNTMIEGT